ncbi:unnamed protein product [Rhizoctonia solani]|nr:unnamed protein product [Rhizoctonia solani]
MTISFPQSSSECSSVNQWEAAGASLVTALANYTNSCLSLSLRFKPNDTCARNLASQIDSALETHSAITLQLYQSGASLSRMRNQVLTPLHHLPEEVLARIFMSVIFDHQNNDFDRLAGNINTRTEVDILRMYRRRRDLISVCSTWRNTISTRAVFWSTILVTNRGIRPHVLESYLQRAGKGILRPVVTAEETISEHVTSALSRHVPQIHSLMIQSCSNLVFNHVIDVFLRKDDPHSLHELSLRRIRNRHLPLEAQYIFSRNPRSGSLASSTLIESLSILRVSGAYFHWDPARAANLVELHLRNILFGTEAEMIVYLKSISSVPQLRDLKIFSFTYTHISTNSIRPHTISFPTLQTLTIGDCHLEYLKLMIVSIDPGSHRLILCVTEISFHIDHSLDVLQDLPNVEGLMEVLKLAPVDSLLLDGDCGELLRWGMDLCDFLACTPKLKTLKLGGWTMNSSLWDALVRPNINDTEEDSDHSEFPRLRSLHLISVRICEEEGLKTLVQSHQIQRLELSLRQSSPEEPRRPQPLSVETVEWLRSEVPELHLVDLENHPPDLNIFTRELDDDFW